MKNVDIYQVVDSAIRELEDIAGSQRHRPGYQDGIQDALRIIRAHTDLPFARWIQVDPSKQRCSNCEVTHFIAQYPAGKAAFCPNCGSRMQGPCETMAIHKEESRVFYDPFFQWRDEDTFVFVFEDESNYDDDGLRFWYNCEYWASDGSWHYEVLWEDDQEQFLFTQEERSEIKRIMQYAMEHGKLPDDIQIRTRQ